MLPWVWLNTSRLSRYTHYQLSWPVANGFNLDTWSLICQPLAFLHLPLGTMNFVMWNSKWYCWLKSGWKWNKKGLNFAPNWHVLIWVIIDQRKTILLRDGPRILYRQLEKWISPYLWVYCCLLYCILDHKWLILKFWSTLMDHGGDIFFWITKSLNLFI